MKTPETVDVGANALAGTGSQCILNGARKMYGKEKSLKNPFGDGTTGQKIIQVLGNWCRPRENEKANISGMPISGSSFESFVSFVVDSAVHWLSNNRSHDFRFSGIFGYLITGNASGSR
jgi:hypothetical protein